MVKLVCDLIKTENTWIRKRKQEPIQCTFITLNNNKSFQFYFIFTFYTLLTKIRSEIWEEFNSKEDSTNTRPSEVLTSGRSILYRQEKLLLSYLFESCEQSCWNCTSCLYYCTDKLASECLKLLHHSRKKFNILTLSCCYNTRWVSCRFINTKRN